MPNPSEETEAQKDRNAPPNHAEPGCARPRRPVPHGLGPGTPWGCPRPLPRRGGRQDAGADRPPPGRGPRSCHVPTHHPRENGASRAEDSSRRAEVARGGRDAGAAGTGRTLGVLRAAEARARPVRWVGHGALDWERWQLTDSSFKVSPRYRHQWSCQVRKLRHREDTCQRSRRPSVGTQDSHLRGRLPPLTVTCNR